jgi:hypothetical protein
MNAVTKMLKKMIAVEYLIRSLMQRAGAGKALLRGRQTIMTQRPNPLSEL